MAQITAALVKQLRDKTGAGMMDCKKALTETDGELEAAVDWLRKSGLAQAQRKAGRTAAEGLIGLATAPGKAAMVEINAETDFVARNADFQAVVREVATLALDCEGDVERLSAASYPGTGRTVAEEITNLIATIGENIQLRRTVVLSTPAGVVGDYIHMPTPKGWAASAFWSPSTPKRPPRASIARPTSSPCISPPRARRRSPAIPSIRRWSSASARCSRSRRGPRASPRRSSRR